MLKLKDVEEEVAIKKMMRRNVRIDSSLYVKINGQPNVINYYGAMIQRTTMHLLYCRNFI